MGANKNLFMQDREEELFGFEERTGFIDPYQLISDQFVTDAQEYEDGNLSALEVALKMRKDYEKLETLMNFRKTWIDENKEAIENESSKYPEGYKGYKVVMQTRTTLNFKNIDEWQKLENATKDFETKSKAALLMVQKGGLNVDADGAEIPLPEVSVSSFLKFDKAK